ncbi:glycoside hydrolase family 26 protein [uncultured Thiodictyon sp.]|uniref:glycoside hydrolase family 26 protein n=1 Tax=uncultured Thiodictyon sp. TaxID=1846217 RepID=UPI0025E9B2BF|nr:glycosyl hydrolase [uncultured Thiodictyon sp.]
MRLIDRSFQPRNPATAPARHPRSGVARGVAAALLCLVATLALGADPVRPLPTLAVPAHGAYTGVYADFGKSEEEVTTAKIESFTALVGKHQALIAFSNHWGTGHFPAAEARLVDTYGAAPLIYWNPWERRDDMACPRFTLEQIAAGDWDAYIDDWARDARAFGKPLLVAWGLEMNGKWFPWSGVFHGGGEPIPDSEPTRYQGPEAFKRAYCHVVERVRAAGASNISWVFHANNTPDPAQPWNTMAAYYPGSSYVDWLGVSAYGKQFGGEGWSSASESLLRPFAELAALDPHKPILLAEWGIGEFPQQGDKAEWLHDAFAQMEHKLHRLKGAVFWHEQWVNGDQSVSNLLVDSSPQALAAYRAGVARPFWLAAPQDSTPPPRAKP